MDTVEKNPKKITEYIQNQLKEDELHDQLIMREYTCLLYTSGVTVDETVPEFAVLREQVDLRGSGGKRLSF